jgi:hypothetical protein
MPEFLVRLQGTKKYLRVAARGELEVMTAFRFQYVNGIAFSLSGEGFAIRTGFNPTRIRERLPLLVRFAWLGFRFARVRNVIQTLSWCAVILTLILEASRVSVSAGFLLVTGLANVFVWWWNESWQGRIDPEFLPTSMD